MDLSNPKQRSVFFEIHSDMPRESCGSEESTLRALSVVRDILPKNPIVADMGCGPGSSAIPMAKAMPDATVFGFDLHAPFIAECQQRALQAGVGDRVIAEAADMITPPVEAHSLDLIWCEGAIYNCGVETALARWTDYLKPQGYVVFSEVVWLLPAQDRPVEITEFWQEYPAMTDHEGVVSAVESAGYFVLESFNHPEQDWDNYYGPMEAKLSALEAKHAGDPDAAIPLENARHEIRMRRDYAHTYNYRLYVVKQR